MRLVRLAAMAALTRALSLPLLSPPRRGSRERGTGSGSEGSRLRTPSGRLEDHGKAAGSERTPW